MMHGTTNINLVFKSEANVQLGRQRTRRKGRIYYFRKYQHKRILIGMAASGVVLWTY